MRKDRKRWAVAIVVALASLATACSRGSGAAGDAGSDARLATDPAESASADAAASPPPPLPPDLDVKALMEQLKCSGAKKSGQACRILREFSTAASWSTPLVAGGARFVGRSYRVGHGGPASDEVVFSAVGAPIESAGPGDLPIRMRLDPVPPDKKRDTAKLIRALSHGDSVSRNNKAVPFVQSYASGNGRLAMKTTGPSLRLIAEDAVYVRQKGARVLVISLKAMSSGVPLGTGEGTYAEAWPAVW